MRRRKIVSSVRIWLCQRKVNFACNSLTPSSFFFFFFKSVCQICGHCFELRTQIAVHHAGSASNRITDTVSTGRNHTDLILRWLGGSHVVAFALHKHLVCRLPIKQLNSPKTQQAFFYDFMTSERTVRPKFI